jgi:Ca2+-binding RTX toxin-like protein
MATYYVATDGSDFGDGSEGAPWRTITNAMRANLQPGDEVVVKSGTYHEAVVVTKSGSEAGHITIRSEEPGGAKIRAPAESTGITINGSYVKLDGFDVAGSNKGGITGLEVHHVEITNNIVHDNINNGIFLGKGDFWLIEGNIVYNNAALGGSSGIHLKAAHNITGAAATDDFRIVVRDNIAFDNTWKTGAHTDGNGIILDDFRNTQIPELPPYELKTLVENNLTYGNSGRGIQVAWSDYATLRDNIAWNNMTHQESEFWRGEFSNMGSNFNTWIGNIAVADVSIHPNNSAIINVSFAGDPTNQGIVWLDNTTFNGTPGDAALYVNNGNNRPTAANGNLLGVDPGLDLEALEWEVPDDDDDETVPGQTLNGDSGDNTLVGGDGNDSLNGFNGRDHLSGAAGDDQLFGGNGADTLVGGEGNDTFVYRVISQGVVGEVIMDFAAGDKIDLSAMDAMVNVDGLQNFVFIGSAPATPKGGELRYENGVLQGWVNGNANPAFTLRLNNNYALTVDDFIGVDPYVPPEEPEPVPGKLINGTAGDNTLVGDAGDDTMFGFGGRDHMSGGDGDDRLEGGMGADTLVGGAGNDTFVYGSTLHGHVDELITGFAAGDKIDLSAIDAMVNIDGMQNFVFIGSAAATPKGGELRYENGVLQGWVNGNQTPAFTIRLGNNYTLTANDFIGVDPYVPPEEPEPVPGKLVNGTAGNDTLVGDAGDDTMVGFGGRDHLTGGAGNDRMEGGNGADTLVGGAGNDVFIYRSTLHGNLNELITDFAAGDKIDLSAIDAMTNVDGMQNFIFIGSRPATPLGAELRYENGVLQGWVNGTQSADLTIRLGNNYALTVNDFIGVDPYVPPEVPTPVVLNGDSGNNTLVGGAGDDTLSGFQGRDHLTGGAGNDQLAGGTGADTLVGGAGNDTFVYSSTTHGHLEELITDFAAGDKIDLSAIDAMANIAGMQIFTFIGSAPATPKGGELRYENGLLQGWINGTQNADLTIRLGNSYALTANDFIGVEALEAPEVPTPVTLNGDSGNNTLVGGGGDDTLNGFQGRDHLTGGGGKDQLVGGTGADTMVGGTGNDTFVYNSTTHGHLEELITDFAAGDKIDLSAIDAMANVAGMQDFTFIGAAPATPRGGELRYENGLLQGWINGTQNADLTIQLANNYALTADDFIL